MAFTEEHPVQVGATITNGISALRLTQHHERDPHWKSPGWRGHNIPLEEYGGNPGTLGFVPDYLLGSWRHVPFEWTAQPGGLTEERYVWSADWRRLRREVRAVNRPLEAGDKVRTTDWDEQGVVTATHEPGLVTVETDCNVYRQWTADAFTRVAS